MDAEIEQLQSWFRSPHLQFYVSKRGDFFMVDTLALNISNILETLLQSRENSSHLYYIPRFKDNGQGKDGNS